jgi:hypothetical protein
MLWLSVVLGLVCFPSHGLCQTRIACGQIVSHTTTTDSEVDQYTYAGTAGETISLAFWWSNGSGYGQASIYDPTGQFLTDVTGDNSGGSTTLKLPSTGT